MDDRSQADLLDEIATLRQELDEERGEHKATIGLLTQARQWQDIAEAATAYYDAPIGSDEVVPAWFKLKGAIEHWRATQVDHG